MGLRGPLPKAEGRLRRNKRTDDIGDLPVIVDVSAVPVPPAAKTWLAPTKQDWEEYWRSPVAALMITSSEPALRRLFDLRDEWERAMRVHRRKRIHTEESGRQRNSPQLDAIRQLESLIRPLEDRFGLSPGSAAKLGINVAKYKRSLEAASGGGDADDEDEAEGRQEQQPKAKRGRPRKQPDVFTLPTSS